MAALIVAAALAASISPVRGQWREWESELNDGTKPWKEIESRIPAYPRDSDLVRFEGGAASPHRFLIDARSLSVGDDGVVRYTLVVMAAGGARNVTFEGIRCQEREQRYYAVGRPDGSWVRARSAGWRRIELADVNRHHYELATEFFCLGRTQVESAKQILERLRYGLPPTDR
jgi:hypothetical protein